MSTENPLIRAITMLQDYKGDLAFREFPDNDEGDYLQRVNESKRASIDAAIAGLRKPPEPAGDKALTFTEESLGAALGRVGCIHDISVELMAEAVFRQEVQQAEREQQP